MREIAYQRLCELLGPPSRDDLVKLWPWTSKTGFDVALQKETKSATIWLPAPFLRDWSPEYGTPYASSKDRHSGLNSLRSLREGMPILRLNPKTPAQLEDCIDAIRRRMNGSSTAQ